MQKINFSGIVAMACAVAAVMPVWAASDDKAELSAPDVKGTQRRVAPNEVTLGGKTLFTVPIGSGDMTAAERADVIRDRLEDIAAHYVVGSETVTVTQVGADTFLLAVGGESVATVEPRLARAAGANDTEALAQNWADSLREALPKARVARQVAVEKKPR